MLCLKPRYRSIEINLLPSGAVSLTRLYRPYIYASSVFVALFLIFIVISFVANGNKQASEDQIAELDAEIAQLQARISESNFLGSVSDYVELPSKLRAVQPSTNELFESFNATMIDGMNVQTFEVSDGKRVRINASFASAEILITFLNKLKKSDSFELVSSSGFNNVPTVSEVSNAQSANKFSAMTQVSFELLFADEENRAGGGTP